MKYDEEGEGQKDIKEKNDPEKGNGRCAGK